MGLSIEPNAGKHERHGTRRRPRRALMQDGRPKVIHGLAVSGGVSREKGAKVPRRIDGAAVRMEKSAPVGRFRCGDACLHLPGLSVEARNRPGLQVELCPLG
jgi:hypothetical protein